MDVQTGETVLLREGHGVCRWVKVISTAPVQRNGRQEVTVKPCDQYGRMKPHRVTIGVNAYIERVL